ncbi:MAG: nucleotide exchange factor GrpE [Gammaproteobacteria bacterium]|uniref:Protein GrpE n=1 Tax=Tolumonas osonensis TaxID=675874 RepID=A0A841G8Y9_9GAMM|nr:nucleotide exchange factor GrpE [Tolumonas osonensis]MBB6055478.1 molecular chaperone GrpE [Tolumonas osonensis]NCB58559.1 nucleotide exchange factor GrpE [Gammaproteobacteria bacterium]
MTNQEQVQESVNQENQAAEQQETIAIEGAAIDPAYVVDLEQKLEQANSVAAEEKDRALRTVAEMENLRRRTTLDIEKAHKFALEKFATELLPVLDNLERTIQVADKQNEAVKPLLEGVELTLKSMANSVAKFGVIAIDPQGQSFDPNQHQAMSMVENADVAPNTVIAVMQKGYELNGRVIRPAMVMVSKAPADA